MRKIFNEDHFKLKYHCRKLSDKINIDGSNIVKFYDMKIFKPYKKLILGTFYHYKTFISKNFKFKKY